MGLFTTQEKKNLKQLLACAVNQDEVLSLDGLHGFLFGLAIIPEHIMPSEWLFSIFGEEMLEIGKLNEGDRLLGNLFNILNRMSVANDNEELTFPFDFNTVKNKDIQRVQEWAHGLFLATNLRPEIWGMDDEEEIDDEEQHEEELNDETVFDVNILDGEDVEIVTCFAIIMGVAFPERIPELFDNASNNPDALDRKDPELEAKLFAMLPDAVATLQEHAKAVRDDLVVQKADNYQDLPQPLRVEIGSNISCPCGSGKNYKQCCGN